MKILIAILYDIMTCYTAPTHEKITIRRKDSTMFKPLDGIRVLDLSRVLAGPLCAQYLGDLGAEVIKIETVGDGDESRTWPPFHNGLATAYITANRNKQSVAINLKDEDGRRIVEQLVRDADVVVESAAPGSASGSAWNMRP